MTFGITSFPTSTTKAYQGSLMPGSKPASTQTALATQPQSFVAKYEGQGHRLDIEEYVTIARALGADPYKLLRIAERE